MTRKIMHSKAFKLEAVRLIELGDKPVTQIAKELGIRRTQLYHWRSELIRLRRELKRVTMERDILKKADVGSIGQRNRYYLKEICCGQKYETNIHTRRAISLFDKMISLKF
jgi:transposase